MIFECQWCIQVLQIVLQGLQAVLSGNVQVSVGMQSAQEGGPGAQPPNANLGPRAAVPPAPWPSRARCGGSVLAELASFSGHLFPF